MVHDTVLCIFETNFQKFHNGLKFLDKQILTISADPDQTDPIGALFAIPSTTFEQIPQWNTSLFEF